MPCGTPIYGLDIETDTTIDGLDPAVASIVTVALSTPEGDEVLAGPERELFLALDRRLADLPAGVIATWNGAVFDLPFLAHRARWWGMHLGLRLQGQPGSYRATWHEHGHVDAPARENRGRETPPASAPRRCCASTSSTASASRSSRPC